jgi:hypothetical protein
MAKKGKLHLNTLTPNLSQREREPNAFSTLARTSHPFREAIVLGRRETRTAVFRHLVGNGFRFRHSRLSGGPDVDTTIFTDGGPIGLV